MMAEAERCSGPLVLVVDDYPDGRAIVRDILALDGYAVVEAGSGPEALRRVAEVRPDVILMDLSLPGLDGAEVTRRLRRDPELKQIPVIALTAHALRDDHRRALDAGCQAVIVKPCRPQDIVDGVREALEGAALSRRVNPSEQEIISDHLPAKEN